MPTPDEGPVIKFFCSCGQRIAVPARFVGKTGSCPACKRPVLVPKVTAPPARRPPGSNAPTRELRATATPRPQKRVEELPANETVEMPADLREAIESGATRGQVAETRIRPAVEHADGEVRTPETGADSPPPPVGLDAVDWVLVFLCPPVAWVVGLVALRRGQTKRGKTLVLLALAWMAVTAVVGLMARG